jgi:hypothetical protein
MKKYIPGLLICAAILLMLGVRGFGDDQVPANLLASDGWTYYPIQTPDRTSGFIKQETTQGGPHGTELTIRKTHTGTDDHVWWRQALPAAAGEVYHLSLEAKGGGEGDHRIGVEFVGEENKFMGFKQISNVCYASTKFPRATVPDVKDWTAFAGNFTVPPGVTAIGIRLALESSGLAEADFRSVVLTKTTNTSP